MAFILIIIMWRFNCVNFNECCFFWAHFLQEVFRDCRSCVFLGWAVFTHFWGEYGDYLSIFYGYLFLKVFRFLVRGT